MAKVEKLLKRLKIAEDDGNHYESHQIARTVFYRWLELAEYEKLADFLVEKVLKFQQAGQPAIALDLAELYADTLLKWENVVDDKRVSQIQQILNAIPGALDNEQSSHDRREGLIAKFVDWSCRTAEEDSLARKYGHPQIQEIIADSLEASGRWDLAKPHYIVSLAPAKLSRVIKNIIENTDEETESMPPDFFIANTVLQIANTGRVGMAINFLLSVVTEYKEYNDHPPFVSALLNFSWLCLIALNLRSLSHFTEVVEVYKPTIHQCRSVVNLVDKIGQKFFGLPPRDGNEGAGGLLGNLLKGLISKPSSSQQENQSVSLQVGDDPFITRYNFNSDQFHAAFQAAEALNPPMSVVEPDFADAVEVQPQAPAQPSASQSDMDLD
ncbi:unnamed protein product [Bursaphelenchus xylophilus]|uniref:(pine wood nematode) hypothetical protein n=1 Tax=Bursaphelenchus xylophilus TaxID=6326 RepID=A0A1I7RKH4_BURXY|nr:unnamed protein product [Bursaphelenchus xylophilus]CAG9131322.1 unnamed protein product [Bursaphelenchus xylophilus]